MRFHAFHTAPILLLGGLVLASGLGITPAEGMPPLPGRGSNSTAQEAAVAAPGGGEESVPGGRPGAIAAAARRGIAPPTTLVAGSDHTCALDTYGKAWCWGSSQQLGSGKRRQGDDAGSPVPVAGGHSFTTLTAAERSTCGLDFAGHAWCWGALWLGESRKWQQLSEKARREPVRVGGRRQWVAIAQGSAATCALDRRRRAWCWGYDWSGLLGDGGGRSTKFTGSPVRVKGGHAFTALGGGAVWVDDMYGYYHVCGLDAHGRMWCWGRINIGDDGNGPCAKSGPYDCFAKPTAAAQSRTFEALAVGGPCGIDRSGRGWCWTGGRKPRRIPPGKAPALAMIHSRPGYGWSAGCGITPAGKALCWGWDSQGQLGRGRGKSTGVGPVAGGHTFTSLAVGGAHGCGIDTSGTAWCWGDDRSGQVGDGPGRRTEWRPVPVAGYHRWMRP